MKFQEPIVEKLRSQKNRSNLLNEHHVDGLFYHHYHLAEGLNQYKKQWIHNQVIIQELEAINHLAKKIDTTATILKGAHLLLDIYPDLGSRFLSDIDFLIFPQDMCKWDSLFRELGFEPIFQETFHGNNFKQEWCKKIGEIEINIEIHTKLFFHLESENWQLSPTTFSNLFKLSSEDLYIHLCGHLASQHTFLKLYWLFDIYFYHQKHSPDMDWAKLKAKSIELGLYRSVQMCIWILRKHFGLEIEKKIVTLFEIDNNKWWHSLLTIDFLIEPYSKKISYFLIKHATKDQINSALRYDLTWFYHYKIRTLWLKQSDQ